MFEESKERDRGYNEPRYGGSGAGGGAGGYPERGGYRGILPKFFYAASTFSLLDLLLGPTPSTGVRLPRTGSGPPLRRSDRRDERRETSEDSHCKKLKIKLMIN